MTDSTGPEIRNAPERGRWEAVADGNVVGYAAYRRSPDRLVLTHTVVQPEAEGEGVGSALARAALDDARASDLRVEARCEFMAAWIARHPEYADLTVDVADGGR